MMRFLRGHSHELVSFGVYCAKVAVVPIIVLIFVGRVSVVQGASMEPGIVTGERILVNLLVYDFYQPRRGDVIIFRSPRKVAMDYIKRVIGLPGESLEIRGGVTYVNGRKLAEPYVTHRDYGDLEQIHLKPGQLFVMGDNRANSEDSRRWGPLPIRLVRGKASVVFWPPDRATIFP